MCLASKQFLAEEHKKPVTDRNFDAISEHLNVTFSHRHLLVSENTLVQDIILEYPIFFSEQALLHDFGLINGFNMEIRFLERLQLCAQKIIEEGFSQKKKNSRLEEVLNENLNPNITALRLLPLLLGDKNINSFYEVQPLEINLQVAKKSGL